MADHCGFCDTRRPSGGTRIMVLGGDWLEFCEFCGDDVVVENSETGEKMTLAELFEKTKTEKEDFANEQK